jgi:hypothetical protein
MFTYNKKTGAETMKRQTYYFTVGKEEHKVIAESAGHAMQWMNRQVMDQLNMGPFAWMDGAKPNTYYASAGNYWD